MQLNLCAPAYVYLILSIIGFVLMLVQNVGGNNTIFCLGNYECDVSNVGTYVVMGIQLLVVLLWTWILNLICKAGVPMLSWFLVILPFLLMFIALALMFV